MPLPIRHLGRASRLLPATLASLVSLFALAPAETAINRFLLRQPLAGVPVFPAGEASDAAHQPTAGTGDPFWLNRYAYKTSDPHDETPSNCAEEHCFDPDRFEPAAGTPQPPEGDAGGDGQFYADGPLEPPAMPSSEPVEIAGLDAFTPGNGAPRQAGGGPAGDANAGGAPPQDGGGPGPDGQPIDYVLLPGTGAPEPGSNGAGGGETTPGTAGEPGGQPGGAPGRGPTMGPGGGSMGGSGGPGGNGGSGSSDEEQDVAEMLSLRVAPAAGAVDVASPASMSLLAAAIAVLALRRRFVRA